MARKRSGSAPQPTIHSGRDRGPDHAGLRGTGRYVTGGLAGQPSRLRKHRGGR
jgi:hypothetical protein